MCAGAAVNARVARIIFGAEDEGLGCCGTAADLLRLPAAPAIQVFPGFYGEEAQTLLQAFFRSLR